MTNCTDGKKETKQSVIAEKKKLSKTPRFIDCSNCKFKCSTNFNKDNRKDICSFFWELDYNKQKDYILSSVSQTSVKRHVPITNVRKPKEVSKVYSFSLSSSEQVRVCKQFFLKTLAISRGPVDKAFAGLDSGSGLFFDTDKRGKHSAVNKTSTEVISKIKYHIEQFPTMESHYCRATSKRKYLDSTLSISKMYELCIIII